MRRVSVLFAVLFVASCAAPKAMITHSWVAEDIQDKDLDGVLVVAVSEYEDSRRRFEQYFASALRDRGVRALASYDLKPGAKVSKEEVISLSRQERLDTVLVTTYAGRDVSNVLHPGRTYYAVSPIYRRGYYGHGRVYSVPYQVHHVPDFWSEHKSLHLETNLYEVATEDHLWVAAAGIEESDDVSAMLKAFIDAFMDQLGKQQLID